MELRFQGAANVYLQGREALEVLDQQADEQIIYSVGTPASAIRVIDCRRRPNAAARRALNGEGIWEFADVFNEPAWVEVRTNGDEGEAEIVMQETEPAEDIPTLWLGVLDDEWIPAHETGWEVLRPIDEKRTAFVSVIP